MDDDPVYSIGDLARRTGLTVKTIRFYSDSGIVLATHRSPSGHRRYGLEAAARLDLVRTLRDLGLDLATIRKVVDRESSLTEAAAAHAEALAVQIRTLSLRRAVLTVVAQRGSTPEEMDLMHQLAKLTEGERRRLIGDFLDTVFGGLGDDRAFAGIVRSMTPELPENPEAEQVTAWVELAELSQSPAFRASMRRMAEQFATQRGRGADVPVRRDPAALVRDLVRPALAAGVDPASPAADPVVEAVAAEYTWLAGRPDHVEARRELLTYLENANDPGRQRYLELLSAINGWAAPESLAPALEWFLAAQRARLPAG
ncbi:DNA-binding transcriptional MerR regulator [Actinoplanes tereljensis]|uniref:MerR family transcriptional regulator n=1 Tax=Paractinoplanes tereljensis TaxID=571912 RepID=A0A919NGF3_9ACTN|nr:MerR family transcriptional regulator [Actinoplanes tereljensis]GIF17654.1 MerR family transcriptional regulator [Actinoplanes tereljensis]